jgi:hypothetical protein
MSETGWLLNGRHLFHNWDWGRVAGDSTRTANGSSFLAAIAQALGGSWQKILESTRAPLVPSGLLLMNS